MSPGPGPTDSPQDDGSAWTAMAAVQLELTDEGRRTLDRVDRALGSRLAEVADAGGVAGPSGAGRARPGESRP